MAWVALGSAAIGAGGSIAAASMNKKKGGTVSLDEMLTPEQRAAYATLGNIGQNGGDAYIGNQGDYTQTGTQQLSSNKLYDLINSGNPAGYDTARNTLTGLANNKFNPDDPSSGFAAYSRQLARATAGQNDILNREAAITGDRYSTSIGRNKADLMAQQSDQLGSKLGDLYNVAQDRSYNAANALGNLETQVAGNNRANIAAGFDASQGGLQNTLNNAKAQFQYNEFKRQQDVKMKALNSVIGKSVPYGVKSADYASPSPYAGLMQSAFGALGGSLQDGSLMKGLGSLFGGGGSPTASQVKSFGGGVTPYKAPTNLNGFSL